MKDLKGLAEKAILKHIDDMRYSDLHYLVHTLSGEEIEKVLDMVENARIEVHFGRV